jgi:hypothetical protein
MIGRYKSEEKGYETWCEESPKGYVFNHFGGTSGGMNILHRVGCRTLWRDKDEGSRTTVEKICCDNLSEIVDEVVSLRCTSWKTCGICTPY